MCALASTKYLQHTVAGNLNYEPCFAVSVGLGGTFGDGPRMMKALFRWHNDTTGDAPCLAPRTTPPGGRQSAVAI